MKSKYIASSHSFQEQQYLERPIAPKIEDYLMGHETYFNQDWYNFNGNLEIYNDHIKSLRLIPCRQGDRWQEGILYEEGKDYTVSKMGFAVIPNPPITETTHFIIPIPPTTEQTELWKEFLSEAAKRFNALEVKTISIDTAIFQLSEKYVLTRKEEVPEAVRFAEWCVENLQPIFDDKHKFKFWIKNSGIHEKDISTAEAYKEFQLFKQQKP